MAGPSPLKRQDPSYPRGITFRRPGLGPWHPAAQQQHTGPNASSHRRSHQAAYQGAEGWSTSLGVHKAVCVHGTKDEGPGLQR